jgi:hypothetical protein
MTRYAAARLKAGFYKINYDLATLSTTPQGTGLIQLSLEGKVVAEALVEGSTVVIDEDVNQLTEEE